MFVTLALQRQETCCNSGDSVTYRVSSWPAWATVRAGLRTKLLTGSTRSCTYSHTVDRVIEIFIENLYLHLEYLSVLASFLQL